MSKASLLHQLRRLIIDLVRFEAEYDPEATKVRLSLIRFRLFRYPKPLFDVPARKGLTAFSVHYRSPGQWRLQLPSVYMAPGVKLEAYEHQHVM